MADESRGKPAIESFLPLMLLIFMLMNFNPLIKLLLFVPQGEDLSFFFFVRGTNIFSVDLKYRNDPKFLDRYAWANSADPDQTAPRGALFAIPSASFGLITLW